MCSSQVATETLLIPDLIPPPVDAKPMDVVDVYTGDDEWFPVRKKLLRPCIALTSAVMAGKGVHEGASTEVHVTIDCCTFDRVLLFLEAQAKGQPFDVEPEHLEAMNSAADELQLRGLQVRIWSVCQRERNHVSWCVCLGTVSEKERCIRKPREKGSYSL